MDNFEKLYNVLNSAELEKNGITMPELFVTLNTLDKKSDQLKKNDRKTRLRCLRHIRNLIFEDKIDLSNPSMKKNPEYVKNVVLNLIDFYIRDDESYYHSKEFEHMCLFGIVIIILLLCCIAYLIYNKNRFN